MLENAVLSGEQPETAEAGRETEGKPLRSGLTEWNGVEEVADDSQVIEKMERETGFEPATSSLGN